MKKLLSIVALIGLMTFGVEAQAQKYQKGPSHVKQYEHVQKHHKPAPKHFTASHHSHHKYDKHCKSCHHVHSLKQKPQHRFKHHPMPKNRKKNIPYRYR